MSYRNRQASEKCSFLCTQYFLGRIDAVLRRGSDQSTQGQVRKFAVQPSDAMVTEPAVGILDSLDKCQVLLGKRKSASQQTLSKEERMK